MDLDYRDSDLEHIIKQTTRDWRALAVRKLGFKSIDENNFVIKACTLLGHDSLLCCGNDKTPAEVDSDYFPLGLHSVDAAYASGSDWFDLATAGDKSGLSGRLQWLFKKPLLRLIEYEDWIENIGQPDVQVFFVRFYIGLEIFDPAETASLRIMVSQDADYRMSLQLVGC